jgi:hypothetical protein
MTIQSLDVPWAAAPAIPAPPPAMNGVDVLRGYTSASTAPASASTASASSLLSYPWSGQSPGILRLPEVTSLAQMALSE